MTLGERIRARRMALRMSQELLAERVGVSRQAVTKWEKDQSAPSSENLYRIAAVLDTTVEQLLPPPEAAPQQSRLSRWAFAALLAGLWLALWLLERLIFGIREQYTVLGWLTSWQSTVYLAGWLLSSRMYWYAMALACFGALLNRRVFAVTATAGFFLGWAVGELLGPRQFHVQAGVTYHYGWATWAVVFAIGLLAGAVLQRKKTC